MNYYELLGVSVTATQEDIRVAYRRLAKKFHPDLNKKVSPEKMTELNKAYETLKNPTQKRAYDQTINVQRSRGKQGPYWDQSPFGSNPFDGMDDSYRYAWEEMMRNMGGFNQEPPFHANARASYSQSGFKRQKLSVVKIKRLLRQEMENKKPYTAYTATTCDLCSSPIPKGTVFSFLYEKQKMCKACQKDILSHL